MDKKNNHVSSASGGQARPEIDVESLLRKMPDGLFSDEMDAPQGFAWSMADRFRDKKFAWWKRLYFWLRAPKTLHLRPYQAAVPAFAVGLALLLAVLLPKGFLPFSDAPGINGNMLSADNVAVRFTVNMPEAESVSLVGSFNEWNAEGYDMQWDEDLKLWVLTVPMDAGRYEYGFLVDGSEVVPDPAAPLHTVDDFGNENSVLIINRGNGYEQT